MRTLDKQVYGYAAVLLLVAYQVQLGQCFISGLMRSLAEQRAAHLLRMYPELMAEVQNMQQQNMLQQQQFMQQQQQQQQLQQQQMMQQRPIQNHVQQGSMLDNRGSNTLPGSNNYLVPNWQQSEGSNWQTAAQMSKTTNEQPTDSQSKQQQQLNKDDLGVNDRKDDDNTTTSEQTNSGQTGVTPQVVESEIAPTTTTTPESA